VTARMGWHTSVMKTFVACFYVDSNRKNAGGYVLDLYDFERKRYWGRSGWKPGVFTPGTKILGEYPTPELAEARLVSHLRKWATHRRRMNHLST
jgi:hypothetical protein